MAESRSPSIIRSPTTSRPVSRSSTPSRRGPPPPPVSPAKSSPSSSPLRNSYLGEKIVGDYLLAGTQYGSPPKVPDSVLPSNVAADSSSVAALDAKVDQEGLMQESTPSSAGLDARIALEQTAAAAKYGRHTGSASDGADVRWYFCKTPLRPDEAAAQIPASEVIGKGDYFRFSIRDSLALEASFVQREEELVSAWWKEYADVSAGPMMSSGAASHNLQLEKEAAEEKLRSLSSACDGRTSPNGPGSTNSDFDEDDDEESVGVLVKGGLYEVDLMRRRCIPVYWRGEHRRVLRGHWYVRKGGLDWLPLREDVAEQLEIAYHKKVWRRRKFQPSGLFAARVDLTGTTVGLHALFMGEDDSWEAALAVDASGISAILGFQGSGVKLRRGFAPPDSANPTQDELRQKKEEQLDDYASQVPVRHVVFMVHGIGQRLEKANLVDDVGAFRQTVTALSEQHLTQHQRNAQRILFIPCQWRRELKLGGEVVMEQVTLDGVRALRTMITNTVHDVLYYMSPVYCQDIIDSVTRSLNRLYTRFIKRNPSFDGKVSLYGHSLGSVLTYDILCHQDTLKSSFPVQNINANIQRIDESEDDLPKIDRLPSVQEDDLISGGENTMQDMLIPDIDKPPDIPENDIFLEEVAAEQARAIMSSTDTKDVVREPDKSDGNITSDEGSKVPLSDDFLNKDNTGVTEEHGVAQEHIDISEEDGVAQEHTKVTEDDDRAETLVEAGRLREHSGVAEAEPPEVEGADKEIKDVEEDVKDVSKDVKDVSKDVKDVSKDVNDVGSDVKEGLNFVGKDDKKNVKEGLINVGQDDKDVEAIKDVAENVKDGKENVKDVEEDANDAGKDVEDVKDVTEHVKDVDVDVKEDAYERSEEEANERPEEDANTDAKDVEEKVEEVKDIKEKFEEEAKENVKEDVKVDVKEEAKEDGKENVKEDVKVDVKEEAKEDGKENVKEDVKVDVKEEAKEDGKENVEVVSEQLEDVEDNAKDVKDVQDDFKEVQGVQEDAKPTDQELSHNFDVQEDARPADQELARNLNDVKSEAIETVKLQDTNQEALQDLAAAEIERALGRTKVEELPEVERLRAEVAALQEKVRLLENDNQANRRDSKNFSVVRAETLEGSPAESGNGTGEDGQELRQDPPDNEMGHARGNLESSVSTRKQHRPFIIYPKLKFKVETFYAVGSPLGMFLALRNIRIGLGEGKEYWQDEGIDEEMPACRLLLNIFHPYDPVAYRLEPLVCKEYVDHKPVLIPYHKGGKRIHIGLQEFGEDLSMKSKAFVNSIGAVGTRVANVFVSKKDDSLTEEEERERNKKKPKTYGQKVMERLTGGPEGRIDNMLQDATFEHQYISAISSHTSYWQDPDTALFILKHLYRDVLEEPEPETPTMESLRGDISDDDSPVVKSAIDSSPVVSAQDDWDSGDDDSTTFFNKEDWLPALSDSLAKSSPSRNM